MQGVVNFVLSVVWRIDGVPFYASHICGEQGKLGEEAR